MKRIIDVYYDMYEKDIELEIAGNLIPLLNTETGGDLLERIAQIRHQTAKDLGVEIPSIRVRDNLQLSLNTYQIKYNNIVYASWEVFIDKYLTINMSKEADFFDITGIPLIEPIFNLPALWIEETQKDYVEKCGYNVLTPPSVIATHLEEFIKKNVNEFIVKEESKEI